MQLNHNVVWTVLARKKLQVTWLLIFFIFHGNSRDEVFHVESFIRCGEIVHKLLSLIMDLGIDIEGSVCENNVANLPQLFLAINLLKDLNGRIQQDVLTHKHLY